MKNLKVFQVTSASYSELRQLAKKAGIKMTKGATSKTDYINALTAICVPDNQNTSEPTLCPMNDLVVGNVFSFITKPKRPCTVVDKNDSGELHIENLDGKKWWVRNADKLASEVTFVSHAEPEAVEA